MKKWLIGVMTVLMAVSLAACTPTTEKQKKETTAAAAAKSQEDMVPPSTGGASDKVPDPNVMPVAVISRRRRKPGAGYGFPGHGRPGRTASGGQAD